MFISFLLGVVVTSAQPKLQLQAEYDWGSVTPEGPVTNVQSVKARIPIKNIGNKLLVITNVRPQCGCTTAPIEKDSLQPGEETAMNVTLNLPAGSGKISKYVTVFANDSAGSHVLQLRAEIQRPIQLSSSFLGFNAGIAGQPTRATVSINTFVDRPVTIRPVPLTDGLLVVSAATMTSEKGKPVTVEVEYVPTKKGPFTVQIKLETSLENYETIELTGYGAAAEAKSDGK
jgi:hypothetical protein